MANRKRPKRRRTKRHPRPPAGPQAYVRQVIGCLERICRRSGQSPHTVYADLVNLTEATLQRLPDQVIAAGQTGRFAPDPPAIAERFAQVKARYRDRFDDVWTDFAQAFALLLDASAPGLAAYADGSPGMGPDILGGVFQQWVNPTGRGGQVLTPWNLGLVMARTLTGPTFEREIHDRLKQALTHPDNLLGHAALLTSAGIEDPAFAWDWFMQTLVPVALPYLSPITVSDPCCGSGALILCHAACCPVYAVQTGLVKYFGQEIDPLLQMTAAANLLLYGLNGFGLRLTAAAQVAGAASGQGPDSPRQAIRLIERQPVEISPAQPTFYDRFVAARR